jgi:hypothetical protein
MTVTLDDTSYPTPTARAGYFQRVLDRVQALPAVTTAAIANYTPITRPGFNVRLAIEGRSPAEVGDVTTAPLATVSPSFFAALRIPLLRGRLFSGDDVETSPPVVLVTPHLPGNSSGRAIRLVTGFVCSWQMPAHGAPSSAWSETFVRRGWKRGLRRRCMRRWRRILGEARSLCG